MASTPQGELQLWLDDLRPAPEGWKWVKTAAAAIDLLKTGRVTRASFDNDLGEAQVEGRKVVLWMAENSVWPRDGVAVHSANPVSVSYMVGLIERYGPYRRVLGRPEFVSRSES